MTHPLACICRKNTKQAIPMGKNYVKTSRLIEVIGLISSLWFQIIIAKP